MKVKGLVSAFFSGPKDHRTSSSTRGASEAGLRMLPRKVSGGRFFRVSPAIATEEATRGGKEEAYFRTSFSVILPTKISNNKDKHGHTKDDGPDGCGSPHPSVVHTIEKGSLSLQLITNFVFLTHQPVSISHGLCLWVSSTNMPPRGAGRGGASPEPVPTERELGRRSLRAAGAGRRPPWRWMDTSTRRKRSLREGSVLFTPWIHSSRSERMRQNGACQECGPLTREELEAMTEGGRELQTLFLCKLSGCL